MKNFIFVLTAVLLLACFANAQERMNRNSDAFKKIEELEKIKLIDVLGLNEETTLRFFARRAEYKKAQGDLFASASKILDQMDEAVKKGGDQANPEYKKLISEYLNVENKIVQKRTEFINSLSDILTYQQISKLLIFEKRFRDEIRKMLFKDRPKWRNR